VTGQPTLNRYWADALWLAIFTIVYNLVGLIYRSVSLGREAFEKAAGMDDGCEDDCQD
jgi:hypothetical protein